MPIVSHESHEGNAWRVNLVKLTPTPNAGNLRALATVKIGPLIIHGCRVIQQPGQSAWVSMPTRQDDTGRWFPIVSTEDEDIRDAVKSLLLTAWANWQVFRIGAEQ
jgi:DNA-binding cell septation regulator SpoVG